MSVQNSLVDNLVSPLIKSDGTSKTVIGNTSKTIIVNGYMS